MPVGWTEREEALRGCMFCGRVRLVTTSFSPQAPRYWEARRSMNSRASGRA